MKKKKKNYKSSLFLLIILIFLIFGIIKVLSPKINNISKNADFTSKDASNSDVIDSSQWVAVDGLGRTLSTNDTTGDKKNKDVGILYWLWHDTETVMYRRKSKDTENQADFNTFQTKKPFNVQTAIDNNPNGDVTNYNDPMWIPNPSYGNGYKGYVWWNEPIYGYYRNEDYWVLRKQVELLADAGIDFILLDYSNNSGAPNAQGASATGSRQPYWNNRFSYCWDWRPLFQVLELAKEDGINVPKVAFMLSFTDPEKYEANSHTYRKGTNEMLLCLYEELYEKQLYKDLWYYRNGKPFIMSYVPWIKTDDSDFSATDISKLRTISSFFTFRNPGTTDIGSVVDKTPRENGWLWQSLYPQNYGTTSSGTVEEVPVSAAQNHGYDSNGNSVGATMNSSISRGRNMPRNDSFLSKLSDFEKAHSNFTGNYTYKYRGSQKTINASTQNAYFYGRNFQQQWDRAISLDPQVILITGWNEWVVVRGYDNNNKNVFVDEYNDLKSKDIEPTKGKLKDYYYYQMVDNIRKFKGTSAIPSQLTAKTINISGSVSQWDDDNIKEYNHYVTNQRYINRTCLGWGSPDSAAELYTNDTLLEGNDLKTAKVSYDSSYLYFYLESDSEFNGITKTRLLIDTIESQNSTSTNNWEEYEYILNRNGSTSTKLKLEKSTGGWNWEKVGDVEYKLASNGTYDNNVLQVKIPRKYLELKSENIKFNFKWVDNNITNASGTSGDIMSVYTDGDAAPGGRYAFAFIGKKAYVEPSYTITYNLNGGSITGQKTSYTEETATFTLPTPTKTGYTFNGWTGTGLSGVTKTVTIPKGSTGNRTYTASWSPTKYTITYTLNGGSITGQKTSYDVETASFTLPTPTKTGYTFNGWTGTGLSSATKTVTITKGSTGNRTYTANWSPTKYTITYTLNGGSITGQKTSYTIETASFTLPTPTKTGYTFNGWTGTGLSGVTKTVTIPKGSTGNRTYTANWTKVTYTITYVLNGGSMTGQKTSYDVETASFTLPTPTKTGYTFNGWTSEDLSTPTKTVTIAKGSTGNRTYTANWSPTKYTITYTLNGGSITGQKTSYTIETASFTLPTPTKTGYTFDGWTGTGLSSATKTVTITKGSTGSRTYTANWTKITYTITYVLNGGSMTGQKTSYDVETASFTLPTPTKTGYTFDGWTGTGLSGTTKTVTIAKGSTGSRTYTANWTEKVFDVQEYELEETYISKIQPNTKCVDFEKNIETNIDYVIEQDGVQISDEEIIKTGQKIKVGDKEYTLIVTGDINSDGKADLMDLLLINKCRLNKIELKDEFFIAGDINENNTIDISDLLLLNKFRLKKIDNL